jgi:hypothetical protein
MQYNDTWNENNVAISTINFNQKLMESLCEDSDDNNDDNCCLISGDTLETNHITLNCKHTFNYQQIFQEIKHQKKNNQLETTKLKTKQIKCPYCREVQDGLLPWKQGYDKVKYVNWPVKLSFKPNKCNHIMKSGKRKGTPCLVGCCFSTCSKHSKAVEKNKSSVWKKKCTCILKSGKRKGKSCNANIKPNDTEGIKYSLCGRHIKTVNHTVVGQSFLDLANNEAPVTNKICKPCGITI